jgi:hypothetical protein
MPSLVGWKYDSKKYFWQLRAGLILLKAMSLMRMFFHIKNPQTQP